MERQNNTPFRDVNRLQQISLLLNDTHAHLLGLDSLTSKQEIPEILSEIMQNDFTMLMINYTFAYYGLKGQLVNQTQYNDAENTMMELMGWDQEEKKKELEAIHLSGVERRYVVEGNLKKGIKILKVALKIDKDNPMVLVQLVEAYMKKEHLVTAERYRQKDVRFFLQYNKEKTQRENIIYDFFF